MTITYELTRKDFRKGNLIMIRQNKALRKSNRIFLLIMLIPALYTFQAVLRETDLYTALFTISLMFAVFSLVYFVLGKLGQVYTIRALTPKDDQTGILGKHEFEMGEDWFLDRTSVDETRVKWSSIVNVALEADYLFIYKSHISAYIIPKRAFPSATAFEVFHAKVIEHWKRG